MPDAFPDWINEFDENSKKRLEPLLLVLPLKRINPKEYEELKELQKDLGAKAIKLNEILAQGDHPETVEEYLRTVLKRWDARRRTCETIMEGVRKGTIALIV